MNNYLSFAKYTALPVCLTFPKTQYVAAVFLLFGAFCLDLFERKSTVTKWVSCIYTEFITLIFVTHDNDFLVDLVAISVSY